MKKILFFAAAACLLLAACKQPETPSQDNNNQNQNQGNENNNNDPVPEPEIREFKIEGADEYSLWEKSEDGKTITLTTGEGAPSITNGDEYDYEPEYTLSGDFEGQIVTTTKGTVLKLNGVKLSNNDAPVISAPLKVEIKTVKDTVNTVTTTGTKDKNNKTGAINGEKKVEIGGAGSLTVSGNVRHGIKGNEVEIKGSGTITVSATDAGSAINCNKFTVEASNKDGEPHSFTANLKDSSNGVKADKSISIGSGTFKLSNLKTGFKTDPNGTINISESVSVNYENVTTEKEIPVAES